jgi:hypothetical protein
MVAFELAAWHEKAGNAAETVQWYTTAAQRFRRALWRTKAEEALTRLGAPIPEPLPEHAHAAEAARSASAGSTPMDRSAAADSPQAAPGLPYYTSESALHSGHTEPERDPLQAGDELEPLPTMAGTSLGAPASIEEGAAATAPGSPAGGVAAVKRRRRGRRGGRKRHGRTGTGQAAPAAAGTPRMPRPSGQVAATSSAAGRFRPVPQRSSSEPAGLREAEGGPFDSMQGRQESEIETPAHDGGQEPSTPSWGAGSIRQGGLTSRGRAGDPGLSSRIAQLESQLRRLLACPLGSLEEADQAPAGPGVLLLSDSDQVTHYYIEACQTLRIGIGNLLRGGRGSKGASQLKPSLAEHLGISDSRVSKYLKDHCAVRWIQLDEGAPELAHFAMAVLRPVVSE